MRHDFDTEELIMKELMRFCIDEFEAGRFRDWLEEEGFTPYDSLERWVDSRRRLFSTRQLYAIFSNQIKT